MYYNLISSMNRAVVSSYTARTTAFATATGIVDTTILNALNTFDLGLISNSLDTKMKALYPFVGGTSTTHKYNFMNPVDSDVAYRLTFNGGWTHSSTGAKGNGVNGYCQTYISPSITALNSCSFGVYTRTTWSVTNIAALISSYDGGSARSYLYDHFNGNMYASVNSNETSQINKVGFYGVSRVDSGSFIVRNPNTTIIENITSSSIPTSLVVISALNQNGSISYYNDRELAMAYWADGYTESQMNILYTLTQTLQTALSRNV